jgi:FkbM family methyltransferase
VTLRRGTTDASTVFTTFFHRFHRPPQEAQLREAPVILDLGANIGLTMADFATHYPGSRVIGVELDRENAAMCRENIAPWRDRCQLVEGAVWFEDGSLTYEVSPGSEDAFTVSPSEKTTRGVSVTARALSIPTLLKEAGDPPIIDFVKMDIEGAESAVLEKNTEWASRVQAIKVELHHGYTHDMGIAALERMGFKAWRARDHVDSVEGVRA